jgi:large subunit ribosomal protein L17
MFRNMVTSLFKHERIRTTDAKAKELRRWVDRIITLAKKGDLHARRQAMAIVREKEVVHKLFEQVQERFGKTNGGYTRIVKLGKRPGDAAAVSLIELISADEIGKKKKKKAKPAAKKQAKPATEKAPAKKTEAEADEAAAEAPEEKTQEAAAEQEPGAESTPDESAKAEAAPEAEETGSDVESADAAPEAEADAAAEPAEEQPAPAEDEKPAKKKPAKKKADKKEE